MNTILKFFVKRLQKIDFLNKYFDFSRPLIVSNILGCLIALTDTYMVRQLGRNQLSASQLANCIFVILYVFIIGASFMITSQITSKFNTLSHKSTTRLFKKSIALNFILGVFVVAIATLCAPGLYYLKKNTDIVDLAKPYFFITIFSLIPSSIHITLVRHLKSISKTKIIMIANIILYLLNISLNYIFINGKFGFPTMFLLGAALGTFTARFITTSLLFTYCFYAHSFGKRLLMIKTSLSFFK